MINIKIQYPTKEERKEFLKEEAERMRNQPTEGEIRFKDFCDNYEIPYTFQKPVLVGYKSFILDFQIISKNNTRYKGSKKRKINVEIDGEYHNTKEQKEKDIARSSTLRGAAYHTFRLTNEETKDRQLVLRKFTEFLKKIKEREILSLIQAKSA